MREGLAGRRVGDQLPEALNGLMVAAARVGRGGCGCVRHVRGLPCVRARAAGPLRLRPSQSSPVAPFVRKIRLVIEPREVRELAKMRADVLALNSFNPVIVLLVEPVEREDAIAKNSTGGLAIALRAK